MTQAPIAPLFTPKLVDFTSSRVGNYQFSKQFYMLVSQLWVK
jgi:peptide/nickel transport system substrate-binding protein